MTQRQKGPAPQSEGIGRRQGQRKTRRNPKSGSANAADDKISLRLGCVPRGSSEPGADAEGVAPAPIDPAPLTAGSNSQSGVDEVGIHWLNVTAKRERLNDWEKSVRAVLSKVDPGDPVRKHGRYRFRFREEWPSGVSLLTGHADEIVMLEVNGGACDRLGFDALRLLAERALLGATCTRLDICRDLKAAMGGAPSPLLRQMLKACQRGELCRVRRYLPIAVRETGNPEPKGETLELGGRESTARLVVYDKGLEQGMVERGEWVRIEARLSDHHANEAAVSIFTAGDAWPRKAVERIMGVVDFRKVTGDPNLDRREQLTWWAKLCAGADHVRASTPEQTADLCRWLEFVHNSIGRTLNDVACRLRVPLMDVWLLVFGQLEAMCGEPRRFPPRIATLISEAVRSGAWQIQSRSTKMK